MSKEGCWRCGSLLHHRRDCKVEVEEGSAALTHKEARLDHQLGKEKSAAEKEKWVSKLRTRQQRVLPRSLLRLHLDNALQTLHDIEMDLHYVGPPTYVNNPEQLTSAMQIKEKFHNQLADMRDIVADSKNYFMHATYRDAEDEIFRLELKDLDERRQPLWTKCSQLVAVLSEIKRVRANVGTQVIIIEAELEEGARVFGGRPPTGEELENLAVKLRDLKLSLESCKSWIVDLNKLCDANILVHAVNEYEKQYDDLWSKRSRFTLEGLERGNCAICLINEREVALLCGHQLCLTCFNNIRTNPTARCPFCRGSLERPRRIFN